MTLHHSEETHQLLVERVPEVTGKPMKEWFAVVEDGPSFARFDDRVNWLRDEHELSHGYATAIIHEMDKAFGVEMVRAMNDMWEETVYKEKRTIDLPRGCEAQRLLQRVRDEAHRFAITYHRLLRDKKTTDSERDLIPGIGRIKKLSLLHHFGSVVRVRAASPEDLAQVRGINQHDVVAIREFFEARAKSAEDR